MDAPANLAALEAINDPAEQALAASAYIAQREQAIETARKIRDRAIFALLMSDQGVTAVARATGMSVAHVRNIQRWMV
jgi:hypothetical protein